MVALLKTKNKMEVYTYVQNFTKYPIVLTGALVAAAIGLGLIYNNKDGQAGNLKFLSPLQFDTTTPVALSHQEIQDLFTQWLRDDTSNGASVVLQFNRVGAQLYYGGSDVPNNDPVFGSSVFNKTPLQINSGLYVVIVATVAATGVENAYLFQVVTNTSTLPSTTPYTQYYSTTVITPNTYRLSYIDALNPNNNRF